MPLPIAVRRPVARLWSASSSGRRVVRRRLDDLGEAAERDDADLGARALALDERGRRVLGGHRAGSARCRRSTCCPTRPWPGRSWSGWTARRRWRPAGRPRTTSAASAAREQRERQVAPQPRPRRDAPRGRATRSNSARRLGRRRRRPRGRRRPATGRAGAGRAARARGTSWQPSPPSASDSDRASDEQHRGRRRRTSAGQLDLLGPDDERRVELAVDASSVVGVGRAVVGRRRWVGDGSAASWSSWVWTRKPSRSRSRRPGCRWRRCRSGCRGRPRPGRTSSGSGRSLFSPSVSSTMTAEACVPAGPASASAVGSGERLV